MKKFLILIMTMALITGCKTANNRQSLAPISDTAISNCIDSLMAQYPQVNASRMERGVRQMAALWRQEDGTTEEFTQFVMDHFVADSASRIALYQSISNVLMNINQYNDLINMAVRCPVTLTSAPNPTIVDEIMSGYDAGMHMTDDLFDNKVAFIAILNFPHYSLAEKNELGDTWSRQEWGEARLGDYFDARVPAEVNNLMAVADGQAENYIAAYNIHTGCLLTEDGTHLWNEDLCLLSHWNLRDELKACYATKEIDKQEMLYNVMLRIVKQEIPADFINSSEYEWCPYTNVLSKDGKELQTENEHISRYEYILNCFHARQAFDEACPLLGNAIQRSFESGFEIAPEQIDSLFKALLSSEEVKGVAQLIRQRLGRPLRPYDIWYDGFKSRSVIPEDELTAKTRALYPDAEAYGKDIPRLLSLMGFKADLAQFTANHIVVEPARGSGHAWPMCGYDEPARLRTRIAPQGMDYKGYNIAVHEMGHNVEEVTSIFIDHYLLAGIPNVGFTEASAFLFQQRDLQLLGYGNQKMDDNAVLDAFWGMYEIMGVSLVDMKMWQWLYEHPDANAEQLKEQVLVLAAEVWNTYFYPVLGEKDCVLLGIYSHMVNSPMYLPNYPIGHIVHFQVEEKLAQCNTNEEFAEEYLRIYRQGRLTPLWWMQGAVGNDLSVEPVLSRVRKILE